MCVYICIYVAIHYIYIIIYITYESNGTNSACVPPRCRPW